MCMLFIVRSALLSVMLRDREGLPQEGLEVRVSAGQCLHLQALIPLSISGFEVCLSLLLHAPSQACQCCRVPRWCCWEIFTALILPPVSSLPPNPGVSVSH